jgi:prepilin-type N-terminal cleavage/methylation domain-containing protein
LDHAETQEKDCHLDNSRTGHNELGGHCLASRQFGDAQNISGPYIRLRANVQRFEQSSGFTLIELSIVLVIIGLLIGGVIVGRELIEVSKIRAAGSQLQQYNTAANTFKLKYGSLPGDMLTAKAQSFGLPYHHSSTASGPPDNNGIINCSVSTYCTDPDNHYYDKIGAESGFFFMQLAASGLIEGRYAINGSGYDLSGTYVGGPYPSMTKAGIDFPASKLDSLAGLLPISSDIVAGNWLLFCRGDDSQTMSAAAWIWQFCTLPTAVDSIRSTPDQGRVSPASAFGLDSKFDDGVPERGNVRVVAWLGSTVQQDNIATNCVTSTASTNYNTTNSAKLCTLVFKLQ